MSKKNITMKTIENSPLSFFYTLWLMEGKSREINYGKFIIDILTHDSKCKYTGVNGREIKINIYEKGADTLSGQYYAKINPYTLRKPLSLLSVINTNI